MKLPVLLSYAYKHPETIELMREHKDKLRVLIDSGAYTVKSRGITVELEEYEDFLHSIEGLYDEAIQLDVISDPKATRENFEKHLLPVIPVFTRGAKIEELAEKDRFKDRICIACPISVHEGLLDYLNYIFNNMGDLDAHVLGFTDANIFNAKNPPTTIDSSSWSAGFRFGVINRPGYKIDYELCNNPKHKDYPKAKTYLRSLGVEIERLRDRREWRCTPDALLWDLTFRAAVYYSMQVQYRFPGKAYYCAFSVPSQLENLVKAFDYLKTRGEKE